MALKSSFAVIAKGIAAIRRRRWRMNADGSDQINLSNNAFGDHGPSWSVNVNNAPPGENFPDAAQPVTINFDNLLTGVLVTNQYSQVKFSGTSFSGGQGGPQGYDIYTRSNFGSGGSTPNAIVSHYNPASTNPTYVPNTGPIFLDFTVPVNDLSFSLLNVRSLQLDVWIYVNRSFYGYYPIWINGNGSLHRFNDFAGIRGITGIQINHHNFDHVFQRYATLYYDDFTFTPDFDVRITNYKIITPQGARYILNGTTQDALLAAEVVLDTELVPGNQTGGSYSWSLEGNPTIIGANNQASIQLRWKETGSYKVILTYSKNGYTATAGMTVKVIAPTLTSFTAYADPEQVTRNMGCSKADNLSNNYASVSLGCWKGGQSPKSGIVFTAQAQIPSLTYLTEAGEAGIKIKQYIRTFRKRINDLDKNGTFECEGHRDANDNLVLGWQVDGGEDLSPFFGFPPKFYQGNTIRWTALDAPASYLDGTSLSGATFMHDASFTEEAFETYVDYFVGPNPYQPSFTMPLKLTTESTYKYSKISWSRNLQVVFDPSVPTVKYQLMWSNSSQGNIPVTGTNVLPPFQGNGSSADNKVLPCAGGPASTNKIDGARCFVKQLYWDFLNRTPDQAGWDFWLGGITQCAFDVGCINYKRLEVAKAFFYSGEFIQSDPEMANPPGSPNFDPAVYNRAFVRHCYNNFLRRAPDQEGWDFWTNGLNGHGDYNAIINAFILSIEYRERPFALPGMHVNFKDFHPCP